MGDAKLQTVYSQVAAERNDPEAEGAALLALRLRSMRPFSGFGPYAQYDYPDELTAEDRVEVEGLLDALIGS